MGERSYSRLPTNAIMAIACGYEDANDAARLASDPVHKLLVGRDPVKGDDLASQPTLSRFENSVGRKELFRMAEALEVTSVRRIVLHFQQAFPFRDTFTRLALSLGAQTG